MKLASVRYEGRDLVVIADEGGRLFDVAALGARFEPGSASPRTPVGDMLDLIRSGPDLLAALRAAAARAPADAAVPAEAVTAWHPPVRRPGKICAVAMNNSASNERKISAPDHPAFFLKPSSCLIGHGEPIRIRRYYGSVHPEPELAAVIGRTARDVPAERALEHVFGYTIFNDITGNGMRAEDLFHYWAVYAKEGDPSATKRVEQHLSYAGRYKGTDTFGALGPWLVTADEIANPDDLQVTCSVGGEIVADDSTRYYNYKVAEVLSFISQFHTLEPGDVISFGTAFKPGAGNRKSIHHANLQTVPGPVRISIQGLGTQENPVVVEDVAIGEWRLP